MPSRQVSTFHSKGKSDDLALPCSNEYKFWKRLGRDLPSTGAAIPLQTSVHQEMHINECKFWERLGSMTQSCDRFPIPPLSTRKGTCPITSQLEQVLLQLLQDVLEFYNFWARFYDGFYARGTGRT